MIVTEGAPGTAEIEIAIEIEAEIEVEIEAEIDTGLEIDLETDLEIAAVGHAERSLGLLLLFEIVSDLVGIMAEVLPSLLLLIKPTSFGMDFNGLSE